MEMLWLNLNTKYEEGWDLGLYVYNATATMSSNADVPGSIQWWFQLLYNYFDGFSQSTELSWFLVKVKWIKRGFKSSTLLIGFLTELKSVTKKNIGVDWGAMPESTILRLVEPMKTQNWAWFPSLYFMM